MSAELQALLDDFSETESEQDIAQLAEARPERSDIAIETSRGLCRAIDRLGSLLTKSLSRLNGVGEITAKPGNISA